MYIFSFLKNLLRRSNWGTIVFFVLNAVLVMGLFASSGPETLGQIAIIYVVSIVISLSPVGEWFLGLISGARKMTRMDMRSRIAPIVARVQRKAMAKTADMPQFVVVKVMYDPNPNAFALGRHTICVTEGLFELPDEMIEGILAHEFAHLALHHTDIQLAVGSGNFLVTGFLLALQLASAISNGIATALTVDRDTRPAGCLLSLISLSCAALVWLWTKFCMLFLMWSSRANEYEADKYAYEIGLGYELAEALDTLGAGTPQNSFLRALYATHPETNDRIGRLQELGVPYTRF